MCGIAGILGDRPGLEQDARRMASTLAHRGPDGSGVWVDRDASVALAHRRLSILDLSEAGSQPMISASGRYILVYNGEIYSFTKLRDELRSRGHSFVGGSDTEVVLAALEVWGREALNRFVGMFAFALWDRQQRRLLLARDRLGIKPLYLGRWGGTWAFASELRAFEALPDFPRDIDENALALFFRHACVPAGHAIYRVIEKVEPGWCVELAEGSVPKRYQWWSATSTAVAAACERRPRDDSQAAQEIETALDTAVADRLVADVPLGVFLSGGIDSSVVTASMQAQSTAPVRTFSIGFQDAAYDESGDAERVAAHLGTDHTTLTASPDEAMAVVPQLGSLYDEPFADSSQIPTMLVCQLARGHVTVALSGDGGDELFGGYNRHVWASRLAAMQRHVGSGPRTIASRVLRSRSPEQWNTLAAQMECIVPWVRAKVPRTPGDKAHKLANLLSADDVDALYRALTGIWHDPAQITGHNPAPAWVLPIVEGLSDTERMMLADTLGYLPDDILTKVDRASMAFGLEVRVPLLDHRLLESVWKLDPRHKIRNGTSKKVLRDVLARRVPRALFERPKMGFGVPIDTWLRGPLRDWAEDLLDAQSIEDDGLLDSEVVRSTWLKHLEGREAVQHRLWCILMFQAWKRSR